MHDDDEPSYNMTHVIILGAMVVAIMLVFFVNNRLDNSYRGATLADECHRQSGPNQYLYKQCVDELRPVYRCLARNPNDRTCWGLEGSE